MNNKNLSKTVIAAKNKTPQPEVNKPITSKGNKTPDSDIDTSS